jgi:hypothetical protein
MRIWPSQKIFFRYIFLETLPSKDLWNLAVTEGKQWKLKFSKLSKNSLTAWKSGLSFGPWNTRLWQRIRNEHRSVWLGISYSFKSLDETLRRNFSLIVLFFLIPTFVVPIWHLTQSFFQFRPHLNLQNDPSSHPPRFPTRPPGESLPGGQSWSLSNCFQAQAIRPRFLSSSVASRNAAQEAANISQPLSETVRNVAEQAQRVVGDSASVEGFKAGVLYTVLAGSVATAAVMMFSLAGERTVEGKDLLWRVLDSVVNSLSGWETMFGFNGWWVEEALQPLVSLRYNTTWTEFLTLGAVWAVRTDSGLGGFCYSVRLGLVILFE